MIDSIEKLRGALEESAAGAAAYLASRLSAKHGFPGREFYGLAFSIWLWCGYGVTYEPQIRAALELICSDQRRTRDPRYHWEFIRFGLQNALSEAALPITATRDVLGRERFTYTWVANWTLLRASVRLHQASPMQWGLGHLEAMIALFVFQTRAGFIEDTRHSPTLQYHAFSTALLGLQLAQSRAMRSLYRRPFRKAIEALDVLTLSGGEMNYVGRGQAQSFGYASAILAFCLAGRYIGDTMFLRRAAEVLERLSFFRRSDGSFPLVLREGEMVAEEARTPLDPRFLGWYSYNNFFDYLPFAAALLRRSARVLEGMAEQRLPTVERPSRLTERRLNDFLIVRGPRYTAVVLPPKAYLPSAQPYPFLEIDRRYPLPCYGGEVKPTGLYSPYGLPLPTLVAPDGTRYLLQGGKMFGWVGPLTFTGEGRLFRLRRSFEFLEAEIRISDEVTVSSDCRGWRLEAPRILVYCEGAVQQDSRLLSLPGLLIESDLPLRRCTEPCYCALGMLALYTGETEVMTEEQTFIFRTAVILSLTARSRGEV